MTPERWQQVREVLAAALAMPSNGRAAFLNKTCAHDAELRSEVESLLESHEHAGSLFLSMPVADVKGALSQPTNSKRTGSRIGVYQIEEEIGRGGMGEVYRAIRADGQYKKEVAIKLVRGGYDGAAVLERFLHERQILASLDHPNIARLFDGGTSDDGLPYLVMELIEGTPVDQYCKEHDLNTDERLKLFTQVCSAVQYAHQRLVIHRDIKPSNILVTADGIPKLLDFGIAKLLDSATGPEATLLRAMTPEYASPEQIRGEAITTATDVYSLGVVLYRLLTGRSPYAVSTRAPLELARVVCDTEPKKPSSSWQGDEKDRSSPDQFQSQSVPRGQYRRLRGDLDNIILKALRKEPAQRYASVEQFAEDIRRHLERLPVIATRGSWTYRAKKFVLRHKVGVSAAAIVIVAIMGGAATTVREARIAAANARRAERRFNDVRKLANSFLFEFHDSIEHLQGSTPARELIVKRALEYLDSLSQESSSDPTLQRELVRAYEKVGTVQGSPYRDNLGNSKGARDSFQKAIRLLEQLIKASPDDSDLRSEAARDYGELGDIVNAGGDLKSAMELYRTGLDRLAADPHPNLKTRVRVELLSDRYGLGLVTTGQLGKAADNFQTALKVIDEVVAQDPSDHETVRDKAVTNIHLADCYGKMRRLADALAALRVAHSVLESLAQPGNAQSVRDIGLSDVRTADMFLKIGDAHGALAIYSKVYEQDQIASRADPSDVLLRRDTFIDLSNVALAQAALGKTTEAIANQSKAVALNEAETVKDPGSEMLRKDLETNYFQLGDILRKAHQDRDAWPRFRKAHELTQAMFQNDPTRTELRADLASIEMNESDLRLKFGDAKAALQGYRDAMAIAEPLALSSPENGEWQILLAQLSQRLGEYYALQAKSEKQEAQQKDAGAEALHWLRKSAELWKQLEQHKALGSDYADRPAQTERNIIELMMDRHS